MSCPGIRSACCPALCCKMSSFNTFFWKHRHFQHPTSDTNLCICWVCLFVSNNINQLKRVCTGLTIVSLPLEGGTSKPLNSEDGRRPHEGDTRTRQILPESLWRGLSLPTPGLPTWSPWNCENTYLLFLSHWDLSQQPPGK